MSSINDEAETYLCGVEKGTLTLKLYCSVAKSHPSLCNPMDYSMPVSSVLHYLPEFAEIHVH